MANNENFDSNKLTFLDPIEHVELGEINNKSDNQSEAINIQNEMINKQSEIINHLATMISDQHRMINSLKESTRETRLFSITSILIAIIALLKS